MCRIMLTTFLYINWRQASCGHISGVLFKFEYVNIYCCKVGFVWKMSLYPLQIGVIQGYCKGDRALLLSP